MSEHRSTITFSKGPFMLVCIALLVLLVVLLLAVSKKPETDAEESDLGKVLAEGKVALVPLIDEDGKIAIYAPNGNKVEPCGRVVNGKVEGKCKVAGKMTHFGTFTFTVHVASPPCTAGFDSDNNIYEVHAERDPNRPRKWKAGQVECHDAPRDQHRWP